MCCYITHNISIALLKALTLILIRLYEVCKENELKYLVMEEPDSRTSNPRAPQCMKADAFFWMVTIMRKLMRMIYKEKTSVETDVKIAHFLDVITSHKFRAKRYITISNSMINILAELNPEGVVYDYHMALYLMGIQDILQMKR